MYRTQHSAHLPHPPRLSLLFLQNCDIEKPRVGCERDARYRCAVSSAKGCNLSTKNRKHPHAQFNFDAIANGKMLILFFPRGYPHAEGSVGGDFCVVDPVSSLKGRFASDGLCLSMVYVRGRYVSSLLWDDCLES